jgi:hypothetical protein
MTSEVSSRRGFAEIHRWQIEMVERLGIDVRLETCVAEALLADGDFETVVLATGSLPRRDGYTSLRPGAPGIAGADLKHVRSVWDVFLSPEQFDGPVIIVEDDPHLSGTAAAEKLAERGHTVTIVTPHMHAGADLPVHHAPALYRRLAALGVEVLPATFVTAIEPTVVACEARFSGAVRRMEHTGPVVLAMGNRANDALARTIPGRGIELHVVGDALAPRQVDIAILDGERAGWAI